MLKHIQAVLQAIDQGDNIDEVKIDVTGFREELNDLIVQAITDSQES